MADAADFAGVLEEAERAFLTQRPPPLTGPGALTNLYCEGCDEAIPEGRRQAVPGVRLCVDCQADLERMTR